MDELISIIIPVYNVKEYLRDCIGSILGQSYTNWELLLIDDGSTDGSGEVCEYYQSLDSRIKVFHTTNAGVSSARNYGLQNMKGTYFTCVDADDWVDNKFLGLLVNSALSTGADVIATGYKKVSENNKIEEHSIVDDFMTISNENALDCACDSKNPWVGFAWGKLYKKAILEVNSIQYDPQISICEDSLFNYYYLSYSHKVTLIPGNYYNYRIRGNSATNTAGQNLEKLATKIVAFEKALLLAERYPESLFEKRIIANVYDTIVFYLSSMFRTNQYDADEVEKYRKRLNAIHGRLDYQYVKKTILFRGILIRYCPKLMFVVSKLLKR